MSNVKTRSKKYVFLGRYEALHLLGQGGMGKVFFGRQLDADRSVVIKVMHPEIAANPQFRQNFAREMRLMKRFRHPHAVALLDASLDDPTLPCIIMEHVAGITLDELLQRHGRLPPLQVGRLLAQLCQVLQAAHDMDILHRDLTPANLMVVNPDSPTETLKVLDFGLARVGSGPHFSLEKLNGAIHSIGGGTPDYICPEQIRREEVDQRGDLYSVGVLLFKMLTGRLPFCAGEDVSEILLAHLEKQPLTFAEVGVGSEFPPGLEPVVQDCLRKYPHERPQSARAVAQRFQKALGCQFFPEEGEAPSLSDPPLEQEGRKINPLELMDCLEAWMPEQIAVVKLRGFVGDLGGVVVDSEPGLIRVCLPGPKARPYPPRPSRGFLGWLGFGAKAEEPARVLMDLHMEKKQSGNQLEIAVTIRPEQDPQLANDPDWRPWCQLLCRDLRAYLISR